MFRDTWRDKVYVTVCYVLVTLVVIVCVYPFWDLLILSISPRSDAVKAGLRLFTLNPTLQGYQEVLKSNEIMRGAGNSVQRVAVGTVLTVILTTFTAYPLTKRQMPFCRSITFFFIFTLFFGGGLIPYYLLMKNLNLINTLWVLVLPGVGASNLVIMRSFIDTLPPDMEEAALIDGASYFVIWYKIILPLMKPIIATIALWTAVAHWNEYFHAMIFIQQRPRFVLSVILRRIIMENELERFLPPGIYQDIGITVPVTPETTKGAVIMVSTLPIILLYPFLQKYFVKGVVLGAVKG